MTHIRFVILICQICGNPWLVFLDVLLASWQLCILAVERSANL